MLARIGRKYLVESTNSLRNLVLLLYSIVTPVFCLILGLLSGPTWPLSTFSTMGLCLAGMAWVALRSHPGPFDWVFPGALVPILCCGIAAVSLGNSGLVYVAVLTAPLAWCAILFDLPAVVAAYVASSLVCFVVLALKSDWVSATLGTMVFVVIEGLVGWVVQGKSNSLKDARLESLQRNLDDIEFTMDTAGRLTFASPRASQVYGYSTEELLTMSISALRADPQSPLFREQFQAVQATGSVLFETVHRRKDDTTFPVEVKSRKFQFRGREFVHSVVRDITERKTKEAEREELFELVVQQNKQKERLFSILAHDLRGSVGMMGTLIDQARDPENFTTEELYQTVLPALVNSANAAGALLENLLDWIKSQMGGLKPQLTRISTLALVQSVVPWVASQGKAKQVDLETAGVQEVFLTADLPMTQTILRNLISNAVKFSRPGSRVSVRVDQDQTGCRIVVEDSGVGIPEGRQSNLFDLSAGKGTTGTAGERGSGLGLVFSQEMAKRMGGQIDFHSVQGKGSTFSLAFPPSSIL